MFGQNQFSLALGGLLGFPGTLDEAASREKSEGETEPKVGIRHKKMRDMYITTIGHELRSTGIALPNITRRGQAVS